MTDQSDKNNPPPLALSFRRRSRPVPAASAPQASVSDNNSDQSKADAPKKSRWKPEYNESLSKRRKERYAKDPEYRKQVKDAARKRYDKQAGGALSETAQKIAENVGVIETFASVREVFIGRTSVGEHACLTEQELAEALCRNYRSFQRMVKDGRWPAPVFSSRSRSTRMGVYMVDEARALGAIYAQHYAKSAHYYATHTATREALYSAGRGARMQTELGRRAMEQPVAPRLTVEED